MKGLSNYAHGVVIRTAIGSLVIGFLMASGLYLPIISRQKAESAYREKSQAVLMENELNRSFNLELENQEKTEIISELLSQMELISTLQAEGWEAETPEEARLLLEELSRLPFGSPFSNGHKVTAQYGVYSINEYGWTGVDHPGIDIVPLDGDSTIYTPVDGIITDFGVSDLWGKFIEITTENGYQLFFGHLDVIYWQTDLGNGNWTLTTGTPVEAGTRIGLMGRTGKYATGAHLHYEIRVIDDESYRTLDPEAIIGFTGAISGEVPE